MYKLKLNVFSGTKLFNILQSFSPEGMPLGKIRLAHKISDKVEEKIEEIGDYSLVKSQSLVEFMLKRLISRLLPLSLEDRKEEIAKFLSEENNYKPNEQEIKYAFEDMLFSEIRRKHWLDERIPSFSILLNEQELSYLEECFSDDKSFTNDASILVVEIADQIQDARENN